MCVGDVMLPWSYTGMININYFIPKKRERERERKKKQNLISEYGKQKPMKKRGGFVLSPQAVLRCIFPPRKAVVVGKKIGGGNKARVRTIRVLISYYQRNLVSIKNLEPKLISICSIKEQGGKKRG